MLFVHIPKTGGNSVQQALARFSPDRLVRTSPWHDLVERFEIRSDGKTQLHKHSTYKDFEMAYGRKNLADFTVAYTLRNPWERAISYYFSPHRQVYRWDKRAFISALDEIKAEAVHC